MTNHEEFFQKKQPAAVLKHAVLGEYVKVFASMVGSRRSDLPIWVIDGYAGAGAYETDDPEGENADGSPLVLLKMAQKTPGRDIRSIFIEASPKAARSLATSVAPFRESGQPVYVMAGEVEERIQEAWTLVNGDPVVTFLDPFGVAMHRSVMTDILLAPGRKRSEVLLNINVEAVWRIGGNLERTDSGITIRDGQDAGVERTDAFLGGTWWREYFCDARDANADSAAAAAQEVVAEYRRQIEQRTGRQSMSIPIRRRPTDGPPLFLLTLFFDHVAARVKFADAACRATKKWRTAYREHGLEDDLKESQDSLFGPDLAPFLRESSAADAARHEAAFDKTWISTICQNVRSKGRPLSVGQELDLILGDTIGLAGLRHLNAAWDQLANDGYLAARPKSGESYEKTMIPL